MKEKWENIQGYEGLYQVSNLGRIKSLDRATLYKNAFLHKYKGIILKSILHSNKRMSVNLCKNGKIKQSQVSRLVATNFIPNPLNKPCVNHIDNNPSNNNVNNLEWTTAKENVAHTVKQKRHAYGERNGSAKLKEKDIINIRKEYKPMHKDYNTYMLAKKYKVKQPAIMDIVRKITWKHMIFHTATIFICKLIVLRNQL